MSDIAVQKKNGGEAAAIAGRDCEPFRLMRDAPLGSVPGDGARLVGMNVLRRVMGLVLAATAVQCVVEGVSNVLPMMLSQIGRT